MKKAVEEMAVKIREILRNEPPEIVELKSKLILTDMAITLAARQIITFDQFSKMTDEITELYK